MITRQLTFRSSTDGCTTLARGARWAPTIVQGLTTIAASLSLASLAHAQTTGDKPAAGELAEIVVTAQRRSERLQDVPMSITAVSQETLATTGITTLRDLTNVTTDFQLGNAGVFPQPAIRGITTINSGFYENNVALFVDGLYETTQQVLNMDLPNVQNIQILKGPQGTLYGRNATGGAILIDTIDPSSVWTGNVETTYARFSDRRVRGYIAGPITDRIGVSLAGTHRRTNGYFKIASRTTPGEFDGRGLGLDQDTIRAKVKFEILDNFNATLGYNYLLSGDPRGAVFTPIENVANSYSVPGRDTRPGGLGEVAGDVFDSTVRQDEASLKLELGTGIGKLRSITGYTAARTTEYYDFAGTYVPDIYSSFIVRDRTWQESVDYNITAVDRLDLVVGANYFDIKTDFDPNHPNTTYLGPASIAPFTYPDPATTTVPLSSYVKQNEIFFFRDKKAWAAFVDATYHATDRLALNVGGRYSSEKQDVSGEKHFFDTTTGAITSTPYTRESSAKSSSYNKFTPRASVRYQIVPSTNVYVSYSQGFRDGEWNSTLPNDNPDLWRDAKQETVNAYEIGLKSATRTVRLDAAGFYYDYKDLQVSFTSNVNGVPVVILQNAPKAKVYGLEANLDFVATDDLNLHAGATWLHARYGDGFVFTGSGVNPNSVGFNSNSDPLKTFTNVTVSQNLSGLPMARAPNLAAFLGADYTVRTRGGDVLLAANAKFTTRYVVTNPSVWGGDPNYNAKLLADPNALPDNSALLAGTPYVGRASEQRATQGGYTLVNASATWTDPSERFYVRLWGTNLLDKVYRIHYNPLSTGTYQPTGEPRVIGGTVGFKF